MANPFPGMDPYLEGPEWHSIHGNLCDEIGRQLAPRIRPKYVVRTERRTVNVAPDPTERSGVRYLDVAVLEKSPAARPEGGRAVVDSPLLVDAVIPSQVEQTSLKIWQVVGKRLVTAIELLSPTNKRGKGLQLYEDRRMEMLESSAHFIEIDLIRVGRRFPVYYQLPRVPYFVFLSRANRRGRVEVWPIRLDQPLPVVSVPLLAKDTDVPLDLQAALTTICDIFEYDGTIDYNEPPRGRLARKNAAWIDQHLRAAGRRK